jgi:hypothetical protein
MSDIFLKKNGDILGHKTHWQYLRSVKIRNLIPQEILKPK